MLSVVAILKWKKDMEHGGNGPGGWFLNPLGSRKTWGGICMGRNHGRGEGGILTHVYMCKM